MPNPEGFEQVGYKVTVKDRDTGQTWWEWVDEPNPKMDTPEDSPFEYSNIEPLYVRKV